MKKNIIFIMCDQLRASSLGCYGDINAKTPNIDLLAKEGVLFENAVATTPLCTPARANIMTGKQVFEHSASGHDYHLDSKYPYLSDYFNQEGYKTMYFGKWHLDGSHVPITNEASKLIVPRNKRGNFDTWIGYENNNNQNHFNLHGHDNQGEIKPSLITSYETDYLTDLAIKNIDSNQEIPLFMWLNFQPPHDPYIAPAKYYTDPMGTTIKLRDNVPKGGEHERQAREDLSAYNAMITCIDNNIGKLVKHLRENNLFKNTHIVFTSDHGDMHGSHGQYRKTTYYEECIKVPFIIGGTIPMDYEGCLSKNSGALLGQQDVTTTLLGLAGIHKQAHLKGMDYSSLRTGGVIPKGHNSLVFGNYVPTNHENSIKVQYRGLLTKDNYKYVITELGEAALFNLTIDKFEQVNLLYNPRYDKLHMKLQSEMLKLLEENKDPFFKCNIIKLLKGYGREYEV